MKWPLKFFKSFFLSFIYFSICLFGYEGMLLNEALADEFSRESSPNMNSSAPSSNIPLFSNIILAQGDKTEKVMIQKDGTSDKIPSAFTLGYSVWYVKNMVGSVDNYSGSGSIDSGFHGPSLSYSFGKWSLSASFLMPLSTASVDYVTYATGGGTTDSYMQYKFDRYDGDLILRRSFGTGNWMFGPQFGVKYMSLMNCQTTTKHLNTNDGSNIIFKGDGNIDAYGPSLGAIVAYVPGNIATSPLTFSLMANVAYLRLKGGNANAPLYDDGTNLTNAGYDKNGKYYGLDIGNVPVYQVDTWTPGYSASLQMTYNIFSGFNATLGGRYVYAKKQEFFLQPNGGMGQSLVYLEYWGAFANLAYTF